MRRGIKVVMAASSLMVVGVALRSSAESQPSAGVVSSVQTERPGPVRASPLRPRTTRPSPAQAASVTVAGAVVQTEYGPVQVEISLRDARIIRCRALARPSGGGQTDSINTYAVPRLDRETLDAQSAGIDTVSGATFTSEGYKQSLQSALDAAHRAGAR